MWISMYLNVVLLAHRSLVTTWKHCERRIAEYLDLPRVGSKAIWLAAIVIYLLLISDRIWVPDYGPGACSPIAICMPF